MYVCIYICMYVYEFYNMLLWMLVSVVVCEMSFPSFIPSLFSPLPLSHSHSCTLLFTLSLFACLFHCQLKSSDSEFELHAEFDEEKLHTDRAKFNL